MLARTAAAAVVLALAATPAFAAMKTPDASMHFKAIASGKVANIMSQYAPDATLLWIGGPLNGSYTGSKAIKSVWTKFAKSKMSETAKDIVVGTNPDGMTVTANVEFIGKTKIPVRYVLAYRNRKIVSEIWQIAPNINMK